MSVALGGYGAKGRGSYGTGEDGAVALTTAGSPPTDDVHATTLAIAAGEIVNADGWALRATESIVIDGTLRVIPTAGAGTTGGAASSTSRTLPNGVAGGDGGVGSTTTGTVPTAGAATNGLGAAGAVGGAGGNSTFPGRAAAAAGTHTRRRMPSDPCAGQWVFLTAGTMLRGGSGGGGGGCGGGDGVNAGGNGGGAGGSGRILALYAPTVVISATGILAAAGGAGAAGAAGAGGTAEAGGGGGGGGGGWILIVADRLSLVDPVTQLLVPGGAGGAAGGGTATAGTAGTQGEAWWFCPRTGVWTQLV